MRPDRASLWRWAPASTIFRIRTSGARGFGTSFQFGETLAAGIEFGTRHEQALAARIEHISNGGLEAPQNGITFFLLEYRHHLR